MGSASFPRTIAGLITEDPDEVKEGPEEPDPKTTSPKAKKKHIWPYETDYEFEELENAEILGDTMYGGMMTIGSSWDPGEPEVRYLRNGDPGNPGTPSSYEWEIIEVKDVFGVDHEGEDTEVGEGIDSKLIDALTMDFEENEERMQQILHDAHSGLDEDPRDHYDEYRDRQDDREYDERRASGEQV